eukprot:gene4238-8948_t
MTRTYTCSIVNQDSGATGAVGHGERSGFASGAGAAPELRPPRFEVYVEELDPPFFHHERPD